MRRRPGALLALLLVASAGSGVARAPEQQADAMQRAQAALQQGQYDVAAAAFEEVLQAEPDSLAARYGRGQALFFAGEVERAVADLEAVRDASGGAPAVQYVLGQAYMELGRYSDADRALAAAATERTDFAPLLVIRAEICYLLGRSDRAREQFAHVAQLQPDWLLPVLRLAELALDAGRADEAATWLERAAAPGVANAQALLMLATARERQNRPDEALAAIEAAVQAAPELLPARLALAERYDRLGRIEELLEQVDAILAMEPTNPIAHLHRAGQHLLNGRSEPALADVEAAISEVGNLPGTVPGAREGDLWSAPSEVLQRARLMRADLLAKLGRRDDARVELQTLIQEYPSFPQAYFQLGNLLLRSRDPEGQQLLERFKVLNDAASRRDLGVYYLEQVAEIERAAVEFEAALELNPDDVQSLLGLAQARRRAGRAAEAGPLLERARTLRPAPAKWYREAILTLAELGQEERMRAAWAEAGSLGLVFDPEVWGKLHAADPACPAGQPEEG